MKNTLPVLWPAPEKEPLFSSTAPDVRYFCLLHLGASAAALQAPHLQHIPGKVPPNTQLLLKHPQIWSHQALLFPAEPLPPKNLAPGDMSHVLPDPLLTCPVPAVLAPRDPWSSYSGLIPLGPCTQIANGVSPPPRPQIAKAHPRPPVRP